jgi:glycosyltransferase involved in cell wall biosynthesis
MRGISTDHYIEPEIGSPGAVFGLAAYNGEAHVAEAIESLLTQTRRDLAVVIVDDCSTDGTADICRRYVELDPRVTYERNDRQLGLSRNWRRVFDLAGRLYPEAPYFAWASDHDVWDARWLETLAAELDAHPEAVLASPLTVRIDDTGSEYPTRERLFDTAGLTDPRARLRRVAGELRGAGELVYGLMRRSAIGPFPVALLADRLFLARLALEGEFRQVREPLWYRRFRAGVRMTNSRQRRGTWPDGAPLSAYVPWWLTHPVLLGRGYGADFAAVSARTAFARTQERIRRDLRWRKRHALERLGLRERPARASRPPAAIEPPAGFADVGELLAGDAARLHAEGIEQIYTAGREPEELARYYWLRRIWVDSGGRKPDPLTGPVPAAQGDARHIVGRRRLLPG